jgi:hypothetical protein
MDDLLDPAQVAAMAVYLASPQCSQTHEIFSAGGGRFARYVVGVSDGWITPNGPASADDVLEHIDQIRDLDSLHVFDSGTDEMALLHRMATDAGALAPSS